MKLNVNRLYQNFVSDIDKFLNKLRKDLPKSPSQLREIKKHEQIAAKRDNA